VVYIGVLALLTVPRGLERRLLALAEQVVAGLSGPESHETTRWVEPALNVVLFVPLGLLLCWGLQRVRRLLVWGLCVLGSLAIEATQYLFLPGRDGSVRDVVTNSTGAAIGVALHWWVTRRQGPQSVRQQ
jgi:glycopeptide antibiotics resistance protein